MFATKRGQVHEQFQKNSANTPYLDELDSIITSLEQGKERDLKTITPVLQAFFRPSLQRYIIQLFTYDPIKIAPNASQPSLILQGGKDIQVTYEDANLLSQTLPHSKQVLLPELTHMLKDDIPSNPFATYKNPKLPLGTKVISLS